MKQPIQLIIVLFILLLFLFVLNSCSDLSTPVIEPNKQSQEVKSTSRDISSLKRYDLQIQGARKIGLNKNATITAVVTSLMESEETVLKVVMPELSAMKQASKNNGGLEKIEIPIGQELPSEKEEISTLRSGQNLSKKVDVFIPEPGYYSIYASVILNDNESIAAKQKGEKRIKNSTTQELWVWVDEEGTKVTKEFKEELFPKEYIVQPGPFIRKTQQPRLRYVNPEEKGKETPAVKDQYNIVITATYMEKPSLIVRPLANAKGTYTITDEYERKDVAGGNLTTNSQGEVGIGCTTSQYYSYTVKFFSENNDVVVYNDSGSKTVRTTRGDYDNCGLSYGVSTSTNRSNVYGRAKQVVEDGETFFGTSRSKISFTLKANPTPYNSFYSRQNDAITILDDPNGDSHVGGSLGDFTVSHEYGHAFHEKALGGNEGGFCSQDDDDNNGHGNFESISLRCAFSEGFASFYAYTVGHPYFNFSTFDYTQGGTIDAATVEGAIAAFLVDLIDSTVEPHDNISLPGNYVANIYQDCEVLYSSWKRPDGIDGVVACFKNQLPNYTNYFTTRNPTPSNYRENVVEPSGWDSDKIESVWKKVFYNE